MQPTNSMESKVMAVVRPLGEQGFVRVELTQTMHKSYPRLRGDDAQVES